MTYTNKKNIKIQSKSILYRNKKGTFFAFFIYENYVELKL